MSSNPSVPALYSTSTLEEVVSAGITVAVPASGFPFLVTSTITDQAAPLPTAIQTITFTDQAPSLPTIISTISSADPAIPPPNPISTISSTALQTSTSQSLATTTTTTRITAFQTSTSQALPAATTGIIGSQPSTSASVLTTGAKAGIAIGAIFGAILLILLGAFASSLLRRRKRHTAIPQDEGDMPGIEREAWEEKLKRKFSKKGLNGDVSEPELEGGGISAEGLSRK